MDYKVIGMEAVGWLSTCLFLFSIIVPNRKHLHLLGVFAAVTTGIYAYYHGATAIWVKWFIAFFFHGYMFFKKKPVAESNPTTV
ncbi:MAG: hypothetical protein H7061_10210 [Bdellovibrionaceae bacterium]|nr:hypothetical protein [Bdellovibrio sp.]